MEPIRVASDCRLDFSTDTDADLLGYMAMRADESDAATQAWKEFYRRHSKYLYRVLQIRGYARHLGGEDLINDLMQDTFCKAFEKAATFNDMGKSNAEELRQIARGWLGAIAQNLLRDHLRHRTHSPPMASFDEALQATLAASEASDTVPSELAQLVATAYDEALTERQREVLRVTMEYYKPGEDFQRLPSGEAKRLAEHIGTTTAGLRVLRKRAKDNIRSYVEDRLQEEDRS